MGARKETVVGHAKLESVLPATPKSAPAEAKQPDSEAPKSGVRLVPPTAVVPRAPALPSNLKPPPPSIKPPAPSTPPPPPAKPASGLAPVRFVPRRTLPTLQGGAEAPPHSSSTPPPLPVSEELPPTAKKSVPPPLPIKEDAPPAAKKSVPPPLPTSRRAAVRPRAPRPSSSMPPAPKAAEIPAAPQSVRSLVATAVDWPRVRAPHPSRPSFGPAPVEPTSAPNAPLPAMMPPALVEAPKAEAIAEEPQAATPVVVDEETVALGVGEAPPVQDFATVVPAPPPSAIEIPPSVVDVAPTGEAVDIVVVDDEHAIRRMRSSRKASLFVGLSVMALAIATVIVLVLAR